ncbi:MAG: DNA internalization-related competence protein ComEC/Rec2 [Firmicutes bacterium]|nr:DNA internalization-related competence protein ComEC/Rec2 [Bacillota bacterium]
MAVRPLSLLAVFYGAGILAATAAFPLDPPVPGQPAVDLLPAAVGLLLAPAITWILHRRADLRPALPPIILIGSTCFILGFLSASAALRVPAPLRALADSSAGITAAGYVVSEPRIGQNQRTFELDLREAYEPGGGTWRGRQTLQVTIWGGTGFGGQQERFGDRPERFGDGQEREGIGGLAKGDHIRLEGRLTWPRPRTNPGGFDYAGYLAAQGVRLLFTASPQGLSRLAAPHSARPGAALAGLRMRMAAGIGLALPSPRRELLAALVLGETGDLPDRIIEDLQRAGIIHLVSISGLHVGLLLGACLAIAERAGCPRRPALAGGLILLVGYALLVGGRPPVWRAVIMAGAGAGAFWLGRPRDGGNALALAALVLLALNPLMILSPGFQLSFAATLGILSAAPALLELVSQRRTLPGWITALLSTSLAAQLYTLPLLAYHFHFISLVALPANLAALPPVGFALGGGMVLAPVSALVPAAGRILFWPVDLVLRYLLAVAGFFGGVGWAALPVVFPSGWLLLPSYLPLAMPSLSPLRRGAALALAFILVSSASAAWQNRGGTLELTVLDVGEGEAIFIRSPSGRTFFVDGGGGSTGVGERILIPFLRSRGILSLDAIFLTHPHLDHYGGLQAVVERFPVHLFLRAPFPAFGGEGGLDPGFSQDPRKDPDPVNVLSNPGAGLQMGGRGPLNGEHTTGGSMTGGSTNSSSESGNPEYRALLETLARRGVPIRTLAAGNRVDLGDGVEIEVLNPGPVLFQGPGTPPAENDYSLVLRLRHGERTLLLTGDIESAAEESLPGVGRAGSIGPVVDVLKVAHHGSRSSTSPGFLAAVRPRVALISAGKGYGHPHREVVERLEASGVLVYCTPRHGAVTLRSDGRRLEVRPFLRRSPGC